MFIYNKFIVVILKQINKYYKNFWGFFSMVIMYIHSLYVPVINLLTPSSKFILHS